jgi:glycosyltransferase involved in cell wall biosynthesis
VGKYASSIVANSQGGIEYWSNFKINTPLSLIRNCVTSVVSDPVGVDLIPADVPLVLFAGRLTVEKNVQLLLDSLILAMNSLPDAQVVMFGEGPLCGRLKQKISQKKLTDRIHLMGYSENIAGWLSRATLCVSISTFEGNPNVILEAAAQGCPLLLSDIPAHKEVFDEDMAMFVNHFSVDCVAAGIVSMINNPEISIRHAINAKEIIVKYSIESASNSYIAVYSELVNRKNSNMKIE